MFFFAAGITQGRQQLRKPVVGLRGAVLHAGLDDDIANFLGRVENGGGEHCFAALLDQDGGDLRLTRIVVENSIWTERSGGTISP